MDPIRTRRILITGASGLLGTTLWRHFGGMGSVIGLANAHAFPGMRTLDFLRPDAMDILGSFEWDTVIHCAAFRDPDFCEGNRALALRLNADIPGAVAGLAATRGADCIHVSTDYVFDGEHPPYGEDSPPAPINYYGETKRLAEVRVLERHPSPLILRIPALYGTPPPPLVSPMVRDAVQAARSPGPSTHDDICVRFPTHVADVAAVMEFLLARRITGTFHVSAPQSATRYAWTVDVARLLGEDPGKIRRMDGTPERRARRPLNSALATDTLRFLGAPMPRPYADWLPSILQPLTTPPDRSG